MNGRIQNYKEVRREYYNCLNEHRIQYQPGRFTFKGYTCARDFSYNLRAPLEYPIVCAGAILKAGIGCIEHALLFGLSFLTMDFKSAGNHAAELINEISFALYATMRILVDTVTSLVELGTRPVATLFEGIAEVVHSCTSPR